MAGDASLSLILVIFLLPVIYFILKHLAGSSSASSSPLPPGPRPWPLIGNLHQMGKKPHITLANLAHVYGPLISLRLGTKLLVVGSSPSASTAILKTHDRLFSGRHFPQASPVRGDELQERTLVWQSQCGDIWKYLRTLCRAELFSAKAIEAQSQIREKKVVEMVNFLAAKEGDVVKVAEIVFATVFNTLSNLFFSADLIDLEDKGVAEGLKSAIWKMMELGAAPNVGDFYPIVADLDLQGLRRMASECWVTVNAFWEVFIRERREGHAGEAARQHDFLDVLLENGFNDDRINSLIMELFTAGADTTTSTIEWALAELTRNPSAMAKVHEELKAEIKDSTVKESYLPCLPYLQACVKETLRLHPPAPLLLPHRASETCEIMNYSIPKNSQLQVNVWAIGRDPTAWTNPLTFQPERFLDSAVDYKGNDFEFIPFGAGRRMCPGLPMATRQVHLILASLIHNFDWSLPNYMNPSQIDMTEKFGVTLQKEEPLILIPKIRKST